MRRCRTFRVDRLHADHFLSFFFFFGFLAWGFPPCYGWREVEYIEELGLVFMCAFMSMFFFYFTLGRPGMVQDCIYNFF